jgi:hypothetical protein
MGGSGTDGSVLLQVFTDHEDNLSIQVCTKVRLDEGMGDTDVEIFKGCTLLSRQWALEKRKTRIYCCVDFLV